MLEVRRHIAWIARWRETKILKPIDNVTGRVAASCQAVTEVNAVVASKVRNPEGRACNRRAKATWINRKLTGTVIPLQRGESDGMTTRTHRATGETLTVPMRNHWSKVSFITRDTGKWTEDGRVAEGPVRAMRRGNARGAKGPYFWQSSDNKVRQGVERYTPELEAWWGRYQKLPFIENLQLRVRAGGTNARGKEILDNGWLSVKVGNGSFVQMYSDTMIDLGPMFTHTKRSIFFKLMVPETAATKKYFVLELEFEPQMYFPYERFRYSNGTYMNGGNMIKLVPNQHVYRAYVFDRDMWQDIIDLGIISSPFYRGEDKKW